MKINKCVGSFFTATDVVQELLFARYLPLFWRVRQSGAAVEHIDVHISADMSIEKISLIFRFTK